MDRKGILLELGLFLTACSLSPPSPEVIVVTVSITATHEPAQIIDNYTQELHKGVQDCIQLRDAFDFTTDERLFG